jgi:hypothetical protein
MTVILLPEGHAFHVCRLVFAKKGILPLIDYIYRKLPQVTKDRHEQRQLIQPCGALPSAQYLGAEGSQESKGFLQVQLQMVRVYAFVPFFPISIPLLFL